MPEDYGLELNWGGPPWYPKGESGPLPPLVIEMEFIAGGGYLEYEGQRFGGGLYHHYRKMMSLLWPNLKWHRWRDLGLRRICENDITVFCGSSDCVAGDTKIVNPITGESPTIEELYESQTHPVVMTLDGPERAGIPFCKGIAELFEVECENGSRFTGSANHLVLSGDTFCPIASLIPGQALYSYEPVHSESIGGHGPSTPWPSAGHYSQILQDFQGGCHQACRSCDAQPLSVLDSGQGFAPSLGDVQKRKCRRRLGVDDSDNILKRSLSYTACARPSSANFGLLNETGGICTLCHSDPETLSRAVHLFPPHEKFRTAYSQSEAFSGEGVCVFDRPKAFAFDDYWVVPTRIASIKSVGRQRFFDLTVPRAHHYFAQGAIHHNSGKTILSSSFVLCHWWAHSSNCLWIVSSTELRGSELRNWGKIKELFNKGRERFPWLPGKVLESKHCITTGEISEDQSKARTLTNGIVFVPCKSGNTYVGLGAYQGVKPPDDGWLGHYGDEVSVMSRSFLDAYSNWFGKERFMGILNGNPTDIDDPLCVAAEPKGGWSDWKDTKKTQEWRSEWYGAWVVAYDGRDSPNNDQPGTEFPYLIGKKKLEAVLRVEKTEDSAIYRMQCVGKPLPGMEKMKVVTWQICEQGRAFEDVIWEGSDRIRLAANDAAYSGIGGDRCVLIRGEFGTDVNGNQILQVFPPVIVPVKISHLPGAKIPEVQIAEFCRDYCTGFDIGPDHFFFDARATLAVEFSRCWSPQVNAVDFGGSATKRPASENEYIWSGDEQGRRLIRCDEKYSKFVSELWMAVRYTILGQQLRGLPKDVAEEGTKRIWHFTKGQPPRIEIETKADMKKRTRESPDLFDALATLVEGARRLGFQIQSLLDTKTPDGDSAQDYLKREVEKHRRFIKSRGLNYRA